MAEVFEGTDTRLERRVALKLMHRSMAQDPDFVERFEREARSAAALNHPNAVAVHDQGSDAGEIYLVMEFVDGSTLRDLLRARGRLSIGEALDVLEPVLDALAAAHATGLVHRDIKP
ncbi:MAG TPA: serine/threonine-protein kinase, partial [Actinobacteria bacterium]|nr:serine/threonine-protein kinase [Actinomycetota bacterium]